MSVKEEDVAKVYAYNYFDLITNLFRTRSFFSTIAKHNSNDDCWIILGNDKNGGPKVYDVTKYLDDHPGGREVIMDHAGKAALLFFSASMQPS